MVALLEAATPFPLKRLVVHFRGSWDAVTLDWRHKVVDAATRWQPAVLDVTESPARPAVGPRPRIRGPRSR